MSLIRQRLFGSIDKKKDDECWLWKGALSDGYPVLNIGRHKELNPHRLIFMLQHRLNKQPSTPIYHTCNNRACINPHHLTLNRPKGLIRNKPSEISIIVSKLRRRFQRAEYLKGVKEQLVCKLS